MGISARSNHPVAFCIVVEAVREMSMLDRGKEETNERAISAAGRECHVRCRVGGVSDIAIGAARSAS